MEINNKTEPTFLDGSVSHRGQGQGGKIDPEELEREAHKKYIEFLRSHYDYITHRGQQLTNEDYVVLWEEDTYFIDFNPTKTWQRLTANEKQKHLDRLSEVMAKIDQDATLRLTEAKLQKAKEANKKNNHAGHELGAREFTFTYSPKWMTDEEARDTMKKAIAKLIKYYSDEVIQLRAVGEVGSNGLSHVHCFYKLRGGLKISDKNFKRAYKYWNPKKVTSRTGHEGGHHANVRVESDFQGYIDKDVEVAWMDIYFPEVDPTALNS